MFFMSCIMQWPWGAIEVICLVVFTGYSVTYSLHVAHNYGEIEEEDEDLRACLQSLQERKGAGVQSPKAMTNILPWASSAVSPSGRASGMASRPEDARLRQARARVAVLRIGAAIFESAVSTVGGCFPLLFCTMTIFLKMGAVVMVVTLLSLIFSLVVMPAMLMACGPRPGWCSRIVMGPLLGFVRRRRAFHSAASSPKD